MGLPQNTFEKFEQLEIRVGRIVRVEDFPNARKPAFKLWINFGEAGMKTSSAQITALYTKDTLEDTLVLAVTNLPPRQVADFTSEVLVLGLVNEQDEVVLIRPDEAVPLGTPLT
jgi:tRNA-binding protein